MDFKSAKTGQRRILFDAVKDGQNVSPKWVPPEEEQEENESRRLWREVTIAIQTKDMEQATVAKSQVEDAQREQRRYMEERGKKHEPRFFELRNGRWSPKLIVPKDSQEAINAVESWIFPSTSKPGSSPEPDATDTI